MNLSPASSVVIIILLLLLAAGVWLWRRRNVAAPAARLENTGRADQRSSPQWQPPAQPAPPPPRRAASLRVGIMAARVEGSGIFVSWNGVNDGSLPLHVQWGAPDVTRAGDGSLQLRYICPPAADAAVSDFEPPATRLFAPGDVISRTARLPDIPGGVSRPGLRVRVAVGYGPAAEMPTVGATYDDYMAWQQVAESPPRAVQMA